MIVVNAELLLKSNVPVYSLKKSDCWIDVVPVANVNDVAVVVNFTWPKSFCLVKTLLLILWPSLFVNSDWAFNVLKLLGILTVAN